MRLKSNVEVTVNFFNGIPDGAGTIVYDGIKLPCTVSASWDEKINTYKVSLMLTGSDISIGTRVQMSSTLGHDMHEAVNFLGESTLDLLASRILRGKPVLYEAPELSEPMVPHRTSSMTPMQDALEAAEAAAH